MIGVDYTVDLGAQVGALAQDDLLGDRLLTALEDLETRQQLAAPVTAQNSATGIISARFCVTAVDAGHAAALGQMAFYVALSAAGVPGLPRLAGIQVEEDHEDAAALG